MRDAIDDFRAADAIPVGVNGADAASHLAFLEQFGFPFDLLVDEGLAVARAYGALKPNGQSIARTVVAVDPQGRIVFRAAGAPPPGEILAAVRAATGGGEA